MTFSKPVRLALMALLAVLLCGLFAAPTARAATFVGGDCSFLTQASGYRLDRCKNLTKLIVDDLHLTISHTGLPSVTFDFNQDSDCATKGNCFGPEVAAGGFWNGMIQFMDHATANGFLSDNRRSQLLVATTPEEALDLLDEAAAAATQGMVW